MRRILALVVCLGSLGGWPSAATAQSSELAALVAHVQALEATITTQAEQIAALQTATGTVTGPSLNDVDAWVAADIRVAWETGRTYHIDHVEISGATRVPYPCDFDGDFESDVDGDGSVGGDDDFLIWQNNFPYPTPISSVPEPNSLALLALGATGVLAYRRRRIQRGW